MSEDIKCKPRPRADDVFDGVWCYTHDMPYESCQSQAIEILERILFERDALIAKLAADNCDLRDEFRMILAERDRQAREHHGEWANSFLARYAVVRAEAVMKRKR